MYADLNYEKDEFNEETVYNYLNKMRVCDLSKYVPTNEFENSLENLIKKDERLKYIYSDSVFILNVDGCDYNLSSQILNNSIDIVYITKISKVKIYMKKHMINEECDYPENNALYIMILSGNLVTYGDEGREKQRHVNTTQIYKGVLDNSLSDKDDYYMYDISSIIHEYKNNYSNTSPNNIFFTTTALREYHYLKQKNNAYYHLEAINLPFQNIEFMYIDEEI